MSTSSLTARHRFDFQSRANAKDERAKFVQRLRQRRPQLEDLLIVADAFMSRTYRQPLAESAATAGDPDDDYTEDSMTDEETTTDGDESEQCEPETTDKDEEPCEPETADKDEGTDEPLPSYFEDAFIQE